MRFGFCALVLVSLLGCEKQAPTSTPTAAPGAARARPTPPPSKPTTPSCPDVIAFCEQTYPRSVQRITCYKGRGTDKPMSLAPLACAAELRALRIVSGELEFIMQVAIEDLSALRDLGKLTELSLGHAKLEGTRALAQMVQLEKLSLHASRPINLDHLARLTRLEELDLSATSAADVSALAQLGALQQLDLTSTDVVDLRPLGALTKLTWLGLHDKEPPTKAQRDALRKRVPKLEIRAGRRY